VEVCRAGEPCAPSIFADAPLITLEATDSSTSSGPRWRGCAPTGAGDECEVLVDRRRDVTVLLGAPRCGDGTIDAALGESCDDLDDEGGDGCSSACGLEDGFGCTGEPSLCKGYLLSRAQLATAENGAPEIFSLALSAPPDTTFTVAIRSSDETEAIAALISKRNTNVPEPYTFAVRNNGCLHFVGHYTGVSSWRPVESCSPDCGSRFPVMLNRWQHVAATRTLVNGRVTIRMYYNGARICEYANPTENWGFATGNSHAVEISRDPYYATYTNQGTFTGRIDEVRILDVALSDGDILRDYLQQRP
jgi:cysteine-rich repeat protein